MQYGKNAALLSMLLMLTACSTLNRPDGDGQATSRYAALRDAGMALSHDYMPEVASSRQQRLEAERAADRYADALHALDQGDLESAEDQFQALTLEYPSLSGPWVNLGLISLQRDDLDGADHNLNKALSANPANPYAHNLLGLSKRRQGQFKAARKHYLAALEIDPAYTRAHFNLAVLAELYLRDLEMAREHFRIYQDLLAEKDPVVDNWLADIDRRINRSDSGGT